MVMQVRGNTELDRLAPIYGILRNIQMFMEKRMYLQIAGYGLHLLLLWVKSVIRKHNELKMTSINAVGNG